MPRRFAYVLAWAVATAIAVSGSWVGIRSVLVAATLDRPAPLSAAQLRQAAPTSAAPSPSPSPSPSPRPSPSPSPSPAPPPPDPEPTADLTPGWEAVTDDEGREGFQRVFVLRGGEVVFFASSTEVRIVSADVEQGFDDDTTRWSRTSVLISLESEEHTSRVWVNWRDGAPYAEVTETV